MKHLKRYILSIHTLLLSIVCFLPKADSQCLVDYTTSNYFCDLDSLYLTAVPVQGVAPFSFIWETGETTQTIIIPLALGDYMLTMTDATGCISIINCHIKPFPDVLYYPYNQNACEGDTVILFLEWFRDSIPGALYEWSTGATTPTITLTDDLIWSVTVTDPSTGCEFTIENSPFLFWEVPEVEIIGPTELCGGGTITLSLSGGPFDGGLWLPEWVWGYTYEVSVPGEYGVIVSNPEASYCNAMDTIVIGTGDIPAPLLNGPPELCEGQTGTIEVTNHLLFDSFLWSNGETDPSFIVNDPGTYSVTVTDEGGCTATASLTVDENGGPQLSTEVVSATCGESNGSIDLTATPPQSFDFIWSNGSTDPDLLNVVAGNYSVTVTDPNGCVAITNDIIPDDPIDIIINETIIPNSSCSGFNGAINLFVTPVGEPFTYQWSNGETTANIEDLAPGNYSVTVFTGLTCNETATYTVDDISGAASIIPVVTSSTCGQNNGGAIVQLNGGQPPFTYVWSNGNTTEEIENVLAGTYGVTVTGGDGCTSVASITIPNEDPVITITGITVPNSSCSGSNGEIDISVSPANTYSYNWSNGSSSEDLINIGAGTYTVTVTLGASCYQTASFEILNENIPFSITGTSSPNTSCSGPNGGIDLTITPADSYTFVWSSGQSTEDLQNLDGGSYTVTVTNTSGCAISSTFIVDNTASSINISAVIIDNTSCQISNGAIDISVQPAGQYSFLWSTGSTSEDLQGIAGGSFQVTVTDLNGCTSTSAFVVNDQSSSFTLSAIPVENTSCVNANGTLDLTVTPPGNYTFLWSNGIMNEDLTSLLAGTYSVTVTDSNSCSATATFVITDSIDFPILSSIITDATCNEGNGSIDITTDQAGSTYIWSNGVTTEDLSNIAAGTYYVTVTSTNGCAVIDTFSVANTSNNFSLFATPTDNTSCTSPNGALNLVVNPPGNYSFIWSTGATTEDLSGLSAGSYIVTVTDQMNCSATGTFIVISTISVPTLAETITPSSCNHANGSIQLNVTPTTGNTFLWSTGFTGEDLVNVQGGTYSITVTSSNGCTATGNYFVPSNNLNFIVTGLTSDNNSCTSPNGAVNLSVTPAGSYTYQWSNGATSANLQNLTAGTYDVTVTDIFNCAVTYSFTLNDNIILPVLSYEVTPANCGQPNGSIDVTVGLTTSNTYLWGDGNTTEDRTNIAPGTYVLTVTSDEGCTSIATIEVPNLNSNFTITSIITNDESCTNPMGGIDLTILPAGTYNYQWSNGNNTEDLSGIGSGIYNVTVTDQFNCSTTEIFAVENTATYPALVETIDPPTCGNTNGKIDITVQPSSGISFLWSTGDTFEDMINGSSGNYSVTVTDQNGCTASGNYYLPESESINLVIDADLTAVPVGGNVTCTLQLNVPLATIDSILWSPVELLSCHDPICLEQVITIQQQTMVFVTAIDSNGCIGTANLLLDIDKEFKVYIPNVFTPNGDGQNEMFTVYANEEIEEVVLLEIFDRWGNEVFINEEFPPNEPNYGWDGVFHGQMMNPAVFAYTAVVRFTNGEERRFHGDVTLVR